MDINFSALKLSAISRLRVMDRPANIHCEPFMARMGFYLTTFNLNPAVGQGVQSALKRVHLESEDKIAQNILIYHRYNLINERSTAGFRFIPGKVKYKIYSISSSSCNAPETNKC